MSGPKREQRYRCVTCNGRRFVVVDTYPCVVMRRCPSCNGTNPNAGGRQVIRTDNLLDVRRAA